MNTIKYAHNILRELEEVVNLVSEDQVQTAVQLIQNKKRIFFSGMGRSGNVVKALAIRFMHLGYEAYVAGDASTPSIQKDDLLIAVSSSGATKATINHIEVAKKQKADVLLISAQCISPQEITCYLCIPAKTMVTSFQHAGSLFEQSVLIIGDALCAFLQQEKQISSEIMNQRHANLQ